MRNKTCNGSYCDYKISGTSSNPKCTYQGFCDYQCPKDSRGWKLTISGEKGE